MVVLYMHYGSSVGTPWVLTILIVLCLLATFFSMLLSKKLLQALYVFDQAVKSGSNEESL